MHFGISEGKGGGVKTWKSSVVGYGYFLELPNSQKSVIMKTSCLDYSTLPKANGLKNFSVLKNVSLPRSMNNELFTRAKTFHQLYTAVDHDPIASRLIMTTRYIVPGCLILIFNEMLLP